MWRKWRNRMVLSPAGKAYKEAVIIRAVRAIYGEIRPEHFACTPTARFPVGDIAVTFRWYRSAKRGDLDNRAKILLDSLQGIVYKSDAQITELHAYRIDTPEDHGTGRVVVEIQPLNGKRFA
jgi:Holliday junction resolvase RusA-like endonuclease